MRANLAARVRRSTKPLAIGTFLGLALGYCTFHFVFPNVSVPALGEASLALILGMLGFAGILGGLVSEDLPSSILQTFLALPLGIVIAFSLAISPVATGFLEVRSEDILSFVLRLGLPLYLLAIPMYAITGLVGLLIRERFSLRSSSFLKASGSRYRK